MKNGKRPTLKQRKAIAKAGLDPANWLVTKNLLDALHLEHRHTGQERVLKLGRWVV